MADNKSKIERIHDQMPRYFKTRQNKNWKALIEALGQSDQNLQDLIESVRDQFFVTTASRPYIDRLGANFKISRPKFIGMDDDTFRQYIPILAYQPKQVKLVLDLLLDIFFFKESTTAFAQSTASGPYQLKDQWQLEYVVDGIQEEVITFEADDFIDINNATPEEIAGVINRNAKHSFCVVFDDRIQQQKFLRIFTNTVGSKGSVQVTGGRANIQYRFIGFNEEAGSGTSTQWQITKVGDTVTFKHVGGVSPRLDKIQENDRVIIDIPGNEGSFTVTDVNVGESEFQFINLFATEGFFDHGVNPDTSVSFLTPEKVVVYTNRNRAVVWEVEPGQILVEMPASPPVVKRQLAGSAHINGTVTSIINRVSDTEAELEEAADWPLGGGKFVLQKREEIQHHMLTEFEDTYVTNQFETRFDKSQIYEYSSKSGNILQGITPNLPELSDVYEVDIADTFRDENYLVTVNTVTPHGFQAGEVVKIQELVSPLSTTGIRVDLVHGDTPAQVAWRMAERINDEVNFNAVAAGSVCTITNANVGNATNASDVSTGQLIITTQEGTPTLPEITDVHTTLGSFYDVPGTALYFNLNAANDTTQYHVWFNVAVDDNNLQENPGMDDKPEGSFYIHEVLSPTSFTYYSSGEVGGTTGGVARVERMNMANSGSIVYLTSAQLDTGILGPNIWDQTASFVLSSLTATIEDEIKAGNNVRSLTISTPNNIPNEEGFVIFGFGTGEQEGPVRYLFKPTDSSIQIDPAYVFQKNHEPGDSITVIRRRGSHVISATGKEYAPYITDPGIAREVLQELLRQTKSVGIFIEFLVRFPEQLYATLDVYRSNSDILWPVFSETEE
jgi:hypothetical protein